MDNLLELDLKQIKALHLQPFNLPDEYDLFDIIFELAKISFSDTARYHQYFAKFNEQIKYEIYMKLYDTLFTANKTATSSKSKHIKYIKKYEKDNPSYQQTLGEIISKTKSTMTSDYEQIQYLNSDSCSMLHNYWNLVCIPLQQNKFIDYSPLVQDIIYNIINYNNFIYNPKNYKRGIDIIKYNSLAVEFVSNHNDTNTFEHEHSTYVFEKMHRMIGFQKCFYNYIHMTEKKIPKALFPLYEYTKLFDTMYPSITDYALETYADSINSLYQPNNIDSHRELFVVIQLLNKRILPIMYSIIEHLIFSIFVKNYPPSFDSGNNNFDDFYSSSSENFIALEERLKEYLESYTETHNGVNCYSNRLNTINSCIGECNYFSSQKNVLDSQTLKTGSPTYELNHNLSKCFYTKQLPQFTMNGNILSHSACLEALCEYFDSTRLYYNNQLDNSN